LMLREQRRKRTSSFFSPTTSTTSIQGVRSLMFVCVCARACAYVCV
jgi:hypothetical protein